MREHAAWHATTVNRLLRATSPWVLFVPIVGAITIYLLNTNPDIAPYLTKEQAEIISPLILAVGLAVAALLAAWSNPYYKWLALFAFALLLRELHFGGTNAGFYVALVLLIGWASYARDRFEPFISDKRIVSLFMAVLWTYAVSKTFDRRMWDHVLPAGTTRDLFEENLEVLGHVLFVVLVVVSVFIDGVIPPTQRN